MQIRFWGTRGSLAKPGPRTVRYGGNTSCVEVRTQAGTLIVLDGGTGVHGLGQTLVKRGDVRRGHVLVSHTHWDHIQGLPFFKPLFVPGHEWDLYGPHGLGSSLHQALAGQMQYPYFPVSLDALAAEMRYHDLVEGTFEIDDVRVTTRYMNHPALTLGYRLEADGATVVYATDHEPHLRELAFARPSVLNREARRHEAFLADADLVIHDAQYTSDEYDHREGWGHSTFEFAVDAALAAGVKSLALFHHDPDRADHRLDDIENRAAQRADVAGRALRVFAAAEGMDLELVPERTEREPHPETTSATSAVSENGDALVPPPAARMQTVLVGLADQSLTRLVADAVEADGLRLVSATDVDDLFRLVSAESPGLVILERHWADHDALALCRALRAQESSEDTGPSAVVVVARSEAELDTGAGVESGISAWLAAPFGEAYVRAHVHRWILRTECRWTQACLPDDEAERLRALHELGILDTPPEERFDRHTRIAAALFDVPIALVSLVDEHRQWFKSHHGLDARETPRDQAFCAHAILDSQVLQIPDALADPRFADNPLVCGPPHVRFYAGTPLCVGDGQRVGTLCLIDHRARRLDQDQLRLLADLGKLVEQELEAG